MIRAVFIALFLFSCSPKPDAIFKTYYGTSVLLFDGAKASVGDIESMSEQYVLFARRLTYKTFDWKTEELWSLFEGLAIEIYPDSLPCDYGPGACGGFDVEGADTIMLGFGPPLTLCQSAFRHEMLHRSLCRLEGECQGGQKTDKKFELMFTLIDDYPCNLSTPTENS